MHIREEKEDSAETCEEEKASDVLCLSYEASNHAKI